VATHAPKRRSDGYISSEAGVDSGRTPNLIEKNQWAFAINATFRGGWAQCRPGFHKRTLEFESEDVQSAFEDGLFQVSGDYNPDDGSGTLINSAGGRIFQINLSNNNTFAVKEISIAGDYNLPNVDQAWCCQGENYFIIQDGVSKPFIYNGASARRALPNEVPTANQIVYYMGRLWVARGREYLGGDIVFGPNGTAGLGYRDSMLKFEENTFLNEGGSFAVPTQAGDITALKPIANINTVLGQGELIVFTESTVFSTLVPQDRATWKNTSQPLQRMVQLANGSFSQSSVVNVNEDLFYRSNDGIRSLAFSVRNSGQWGNTPISSEMSRILSADPDDFLRFSNGVEFDNRLLMTAAPGFSAGHGTYHRCLVVLDFDLITGMRGKLPPAWEGIWTGLRILQVVTVKHFGVKRCFAYVLNSSDKIELWEITKDERFDNNGDDVRIQWSLESRSMDFGSKFDMNQLESGDLFFDRLAGTVDFDLDFRPDSYPCWIDWDSWQECAKYKLCAGEFGVCPTLPNYKEQYRPKRQFVQPPDTFDPILKKMYRNGYEFQVLLNMTGFGRLKQLRINCTEVQELPSGGNL